MMSVVQSEGRLKAVQGRGEASVWAKAKRQQKAGSSNGVGAGE